MAAAPQGKIGISRRGFSTAVGKKIVTAITGLALCVFLTGHLAGNLLLLWPGKQGAMFNGYAHLLNSLPFLLLIELGLAAIFLIHAYEALKVSYENKKARPIGYSYKTWARTKNPRSRKTASSTFMMYSGIIILVFVVLHVLHFKYNHPLYSDSAPENGQTTQVAVGVGNAGLGAAPGTSPAAAQEGSRDLATLVIREFHHPLVVALYVFCMIVLGMHLYHAVWSAFQSLGVQNGFLRRSAIILGNVFTIVIAGGFAILPIWAYFIAKS